MDRKEPHDLRVAFFGCGNRAREHLAAVFAESGIRVVTACDANEKARAILHRDWPEIPCASTAKDAIAGRECELVVLALPPAANRKEIVTELASHRNLRSVLVEKPAATTAARIREEYRGLGVPTFVCHQMRMLAGARRVRDWFRETNPERFRIEGRCFGKLFDQGLHLLDLACWIVGMVPDRIDRVVREDEPARVGQVEALPFDWRLDLRHPGPVWSEIEAGWTGGGDLILRCGPLAARDWLDKSLRIVVGDGWVEIGTLGITSGGGLRGCGLEETWSLDTYRGATRDVYRAIHDWLGEDGPQPDLPDLEEHATQLDFCERALSGPVERLPRPIYLEEEGNREQQILDVVVSLRESRGFATDCIRSWVSDQGCEPNEYRLVVVADDQTRHFEGRIRPMLREHDLWIDCGRAESRIGDGMLTEYQVGIAATNTEWIFLTEAHAEAVPGTAAAIRERFAESEAAGFCVNEVQGHRNAWGKQEEMFILEGTETWREPGHWSKMIMRGFGIRRTVLDAVGGLRADYGRFAEWQLAADLHRAGYYLEFAEDAYIRHHYVLLPGPLGREIEEFVEGQSHFIIDTPDEVHLPYFPLPALPFDLAAPEWRRLLTTATRKARKAFGRMAAPVPGRNRLAVPPVWKERLRWLGCRIVVNSIGWLAPRAVYRFGKGYWLSQIHLAYYRHLEPLLRERANRPLPIGSTWSAADEQFPALPGVHAREEYNGNAFRWTETIWGLPLEIPAKGAVLELQHLPNFRHPEDLAETFAICSLDPETAIQGEVEGNRLRFPLPGGNGNASWVAFVSSQLETPTEEKRILSLPLEAIHLLDGRTADTEP